MSTKYRFPAEWEKHKSTWIAWPHEESDWPGKFETVDWVYADIVRVLSGSEVVNIILSPDQDKERIGGILRLSEVDLKRVNFLIKESDRSWLRDSAPISVIEVGSGERKWVGFNFNAWAKYDNFLADKEIPNFISWASKRELVSVVRGAREVVMEGGAIETDGEGTLIVTEECLQSKIQERNVGFLKADYEEVFREYLGIKKVIWLEAGIRGDDTHGHIDDITRFVSVGKVVTVVEEDPSHPNYAVLKRNKEILLAEKDAEGRALEVIDLPMPRDVVFDGQVLPASYANFYIGNKVVLVPVFNDPKDRLALNILADCFPDREVVGVNARDLVLGLGTFHCLTQQEVE